MIYLIRFRINDGLHEYYQDTYVIASGNVDVIAHAHNSLKTYFGDDTVIHSNQVDVFGSIDYVEDSDGSREARLETVTAFTNVLVENLDTGKHEYISLQPSEMTLHNK